VCALRERVRRLFRNVRVAGRVGAGVRRRWSQLRRQQRRPATATAHVGKVPPRRGTSHGLHAALGEVAALHLLLLHLPPPGDLLRLQRIKGAP
jgi:hypothetical protein